MDIVDLLRPEAVVAGVKPASKKQLLAQLADRAAALYGLEPKQVFDLISERERLGSTGVGDGIAIPHAKLPALKRPLGLLMKLDGGVDFDAIDGRPVDLVFLLLTPEGSGAEHLRALARVSRALRDRHLCDKLRGSHTGDALFALLTGGVRPSAAA
jgi:nitrogen PTS system EIIA component